MISLPKDYKEDYMKTILQHSFYMKIFMHINRKNKILCSQQSYDLKTSNEEI